MRMMVESLKSKCDWSYKEAGEVLERLRAGQLYNTTSNQQAGSIPIVSQSENGFVGYHEGEAGINASIESPIVTFANHTCAVRWHEKPFSTIQNVFPLRGKKGVMETKFLYWLLKWVIRPNFYGGHWPILIKKIVPVPPIETQHRIATQLKAQLAEVDKARQAAGVQLKDSKILSVALLREVFSKNMRQYPVISLGDAGEVVSGITLGRKISQKNKNKPLRQVPYLRVANVKDGFLDLAEVKTVDATEIEIEKLCLHKGDILLTEGGDPDKLGRGTFWSEELPECIHQNHIFRVRFPHENYLPAFIAAQIGSPYGKDYFFTHAKKTTGIATINQKVLKAFPLQSPGLDIQKKIMARLSPQLRDAQTVREGIKQQIQEINLLPEKILAKAFEQ